ncbi:PEGA domain-containing protein [Patescibacteria group bacterium]|nr:PEGA domain-containing protein [Patescibacteria group bacterium]MBU1705600.1 PEGA domain-containing protein [Patescibacteria group bacterium]
MGIKTRKILYFTFLAAFFISAPLVVLYTAGYRYNFGSGKIVQTGVLSVTSEPKGADIFIDNEKQRSKSPAVIDNVFPGEHEIRLEKDGYLPWGKKLTIQAKETTFVNQVALFADQVPERLVGDEALRIYPGPAGKIFAYLSVQDSWNELWIYHTNTSDDQLLARLPLGAAQELTVAWSADGSYLSLQGASLSLINTETAKNYDLSNAAPGWWDAEHGDTYYFYQNNILKSVRLPGEETAQIKLVEAAVKSSGNDLIMAQKIDNRVVVARRQGETANILAYLPLGDYSFQPSPNQDLLLLEDKKRQRIFLIDTRSSEQPILLNSVAVLWQWSPDGRRLLYSDGFDLHIYFLNDYLDETLTRLSQPITGLAWYPPAQSVIFCQDNQVTAVDLDRRQGYSLTALVAGSDFNDLLVDPRGRAVYFYGQVGEEKGVWAKGLLR